MHIVMYRIHKNGLTGKIQFLVARPCIFYAAFLWSRRSKLGKPWRKELFFAFFILILYNSVWETGPRIIVQRRHTRTRAQLPFLTMYLISYNFCFNFCFYFSGCGSSTLLLVHLWYCRGLQQAQGNLQMRKNTTKTYS